MSDIKTKPNQRTEYVVRRGESSSSPAVYRGDSAHEAKCVAKATKNATVTYRSEQGIRDYGL